MSFISISKDMFDIAFTENGDKAYSTSGSYCLDYFSLIGGMRFNYDDALKNFMKAYKENPILAIKILFFARDIKEGLGERNIFRFTFNTLCNMAPEVAKQVISYVPTYGRYDDLFSAYSTPVRKEMMKIVKEQLYKDIEAKKENKPISLLAKWMPSINTSSYETRALAQKLASSLGMSKEEYRKTLSSLRKDLIVENNLRTKDYTFDYEQVPGGAMFKYREAFSRNDKERYEAYLDAVNKGIKKMNSGTIYPYQVIRKLENIYDEYGKKYYENAKEDFASLDTIWKSFDRSEISSNTIVVRDGSGSMLDGEEVSANSVATSLALLFAERLEGEFKNKFITFASNPRLVEIKGDTIKEKYDCLAQYNDYSSTNVAGVYELILKVYKRPNFTKEDQLDRIVIISDMEFDMVNYDEESTFEVYKKKFDDIGYKLPEVVFWNVRARSTHLPVRMEEENVKLVSGASSSIIDMVTKNDGCNPYEMMLKCLEKYSCFDSIIIQ